MIWGSVPTKPPAWARRAHWEHLERGATIGVRGIGPTKEAAFEQAAVALTALIADPAAVEPKETVTIACQGEADDILLVAWLDALVGEMSARGMLFSRFHVDLDRDRLVATATGERAFVERDRFAMQVKGATCTDVRVARTAAGDWIAQTVVDV